jgi:hypothetical protein
MDEICAKDDIQILTHLVKNLVHEQPRVRQTALAAVQIIVNGSGLQAPLAVRAAPRSHHLVARLPPAFKCSIILPPSPAPHAARRPG